MGASLDAKYQQGVTHTPILIRSPCTIENVRQYTTTTTTTLTTDIDIASHIRASFACCRRARATSPLLVALVIIIEEGG